MRKNKNFALLIISSDKYSDLWACAAAQFEKNFKSNKYDIYLGSNTQAFSHNHVKTILSGPDSDWSTSLLKILDQIQQEYIFMIVEDQVLVSEIDISQFNCIVDTMVKEEISFIKYWPTPTGSVQHHKYEFLMEYEKWIPYRISVNGFWKKSILKYLLIPGENPWNFEIMGSYRSCKYEKFYSLDAPLFEAINLVEKGKWLAPSLKLAQQQQLNIDLSNREMMSPLQMFLSRVKAIIFNHIQIVNWKNRVGLMNFLRRLFVTY